MRTILTSALIAASSVVLPGGAVGSNYTTSSGETALKQTLKTREIAALDGSAFKLEVLKLSIVGKDSISASGVAFSLKTASQGKFTQSEVFDSDTVKQITAAVHYVNTVIGKKAKFRDRARLIPKSSASGGLYIINDGYARGLISVGSTRIFLSPKSMKLLEDSLLQFRKMID